MKRSILPLLAALAFALLTSCFQNETTITLNKDGSGTLTEETLFGEQALQMLSQMAQFGGGQQADPLADLASETKAKERAARLGEGVTLEKVGMIEKNGWKGGRAVYRFADINTLKFSADGAMKSSMPEMPGAPAAARKEAPPIAFRYANGTLVITQPEPEKPEAPAHELPASAPDMDNPEAMEAVKQMTAGAKVSLRLVVEPGIAASDASHVLDRTITLTEMDIGKLMENPETVKKVSKAGRGSPADALEAMKGIEGVKIETKREVTVKVK